MVFQHSFSLNETIQILLLLKERELQGWFIVFEYNCKYTINSNNTNTLYCVWSVDASSFAGEKPHEL